MPQRLGLGSSLASQSLLDEEYGFIPGGPGNNLFSRRVHIPLVTPTSGFDYGGSGAVSDNITSSSFYDKQNHSSLTYEPVDYHRSFCSGSGCQPGAHLICGSRQQMTVHLLNRSGRLCNPLVPGTRCEVQLVRLYGGSGTSTEDNNLQQQYQSQTNLFDSSQTVTASGLQGNPRPLVVDNDDGTFSVEYQIVVPGRYGVDVKIDGSSLRNPCPQLNQSNQDTILGPGLLFQSGPACASNTQFSGQGTSVFDFNLTSTFVIHAHDEFGNKCRRGGDRFGVRGIGNAGVEYVKDLGTGDYEVGYRVDLQSMNPESVLQGRFGGQETFICSLEVLLHGVTISTVQGGPFHPIPTVSSLQQAQSIIKKMYPQLLQPNNNDGDGYGVMNSHALPSSINNVMNDINQADGVTTDPINDFAKNAEPLKRQLKQISNSMPNIVDLQQNIERIRLKSQQKMEEIGKDFQSHAQPGQSNQVADEELRLQVLEDWGLVQDIQAQLQDFHNNLINQQNKLLTLGQTIERECQVITSTQAHMSSQSAELSRVQENLNKLKRECINLSQAPEIVSYNKRQFEEHSLAQKREFLNQQVNFLETQRAKMHREMDIRVREQQDHTSIGYHMQRQQQQGQNLDSRSLHHSAERDQLNYQSTLYGPQQLTHSDLQNQDRRERVFGSPNLFSPKRGGSSDTRIRDVEFSLNQRSGQGGGLDNSILANADNLYGPNNSNSMSPDGKNMNNMNNDLQRYHRLINRKKALFGKREALIRAARKGEDLGRIQKLIEEEKEQYRAQQGYYERQNQLNLVGLGEGQRFGGKDQNQDGNNTNDGTIQDPNRPIPRDGLNIYNDQLYRLNDRFYERNLD